MEETSIKVMGDVIKLGLFYFNKSKIIFIEYIGNTT